MFEYLADFSSTAEWDPGVSEAWRLTGEPLRVGARFHVVAGFLGRRVPLEYRTVEIDPPRRVVLRAETATVVSEDTITVRGLPGSGAEVTYDARLRLRGALRVADPVLGLLFQRVGDRAKAGLATTLAQRGDGAPSLDRSAQMRVAIVGGGVSGLVAARHLHDAGHEATLFEAADYPGGHTNTIRVETERGAWNVDTGFIVFNDRNYPNFERLLDRLGVAAQPADMSFSVADEAGRFEWASRPAGLFANPAHLVDRRFHRMLLDLLRFNRQARALIGTNGSGPSLRRFLADGGYSDYFIERLIVPQVSAVWSADPDQLWSFPASFLAEFFDNHGILALTGRPRWRTIVGGSQTYVEAIIAPMRDSIRLQTPVRRIERHPDRVEIAWDGGSQSFDEVVIATHADQALAMLADPSPAEREILGAFPYQRNEAVLHTDERLLPRRRRAWASWNFHLVDEPVGLTTVTYHMNRLQALSADREFCLTLNRTEAIDPARIIRRIDYQHPVFTRAGVAAQGRHGEISGRNRTHYCGAYWRWGFHEDGVWSALRACEPLAQNLPAPPAVERCRNRRVSDSAIYEGWVSHRRFGAVRHSFRYRVFMTLLDLDELPELFDRHPLYSARRPAPVRFRRSDYLGDPDVPLAESARRLVESAPVTGRRARCACSPTCATSGTASTRSASTTSTIGPGRESMQ